MACQHEGPCHVCVEGVSFDELTCGCGKTVIYPPIPCGTPIPECRYPCRRPRECGHPSMTLHYCHPLSEPCPPCMLFTTRSCACGKKTLSNIPCSRKTEASCGLPCKAIIDNCGHACGRVRWNSVNSLGLSFG
jgi:transcriptional repressor NF-X1